ncbi:hypothetical protein [Pseudoduganella lurida]|nr:hypothetical protein [Pseudoduganella lurida]
MKAKKPSLVALSIMTLLITAAWLAWQLFGLAMTEFAKGGVC